MATPSTRFFSLILPTIIEEKKLKIPKDFVTKFGHELSCVATLHVLNVANPWKVKLVKIAEDIYFKDGWNWFLKYHSIKENYLLVFNYIGKSSFEVVIFDQSTTQVSFRQQFENGIDVDVAAAGKSGNQDEDTSSKKQETKMIKTESNSNHGSSMLKHERMAKTRKSGIPSLTATMKSYNIKPGYLNVPTHFAKECTTRSPEFTLRNPLDGSKCLVTFTCYKKWNKATFYEHWKISKGWPDFVRKNGLQEGDVCVFELIQANANVLQVSIFRANQGGANVS